MRVTDETLKEPLERRGEYLMDRTETASTQFVTVQMEQCLTS